MPKNDEAFFINFLQMGIPSAPELELFLESLDEVWTETLYSNLASAGLIRQVVSKVWNKDQHRVAMVFEYESKEGYLRCQDIIAEDFGKARREELSKFVFKVQNNRGLVLSEYVRP